MKLKELLILLLPMVIIGCASLHPTDWACLHPTDVAMKVDCQLDLLHHGQAFLAYSQDNDGRLPPVRGGGSVATWSHNNLIGWADELMDYNRVGDMSCPVVKKARQEQLSPQHAPIIAYFKQPLASSFYYTSYWYNRYLDAIPVRSVSLPGATLLLGEGNDGDENSDATYSKSALPASWLTDRSKPSFRHLGGANYLFVDGHVKWLRPDEVTHFGGRVDAFAVR